MNMNIDRRLDLLKLAEAEYQAKMNRTAFEANHYLEQCSPESLSAFMKSIESYSIILNQFNVIQKLKAQLIAQNTSDSNIDEAHNEN